MNTHADRIVLNSTGQNLLRIVIASYFIAVGLHLIPGTDVAPLLAQVLPPAAAEFAAEAAVFSLGFLVLVGYFVRPAALVLGVMTIMASYLEMLTLGAGAEVGAFWRDLVLVAALMLTYAESSPRDFHLRKAIRRTINPRRVRAAAKRTTERPLTVEQIANVPANDLPPEEAPVTDPAAVPFVARRRITPRPAVEVTENQNIFADAERAIAV